MTETLSKVEDLLEVLGKVDATKIRWEQEKLRAIRAWAMRQIGVDYSVGDRVEIKSVVVDRNHTPGWWVYREALAPGVTAVVEEIDFSPYVDGAGGTWVASIRLDREWSVHEWTGLPGGGPDRRYWNGPADETPVGMTPPSSYDQEHYPEGRKHVFLLRADQLRAYRDPKAGVE